MAGEEDAPQESELGFTTASGCAAGLPGTMGRGYRHAMRSLRVKDEV
jgi:hypothetical protein